MSKDLLHVGKAQANWSANGTRILKYTVEMQHKGLNEHKLISAPDLDVLGTKADFQAQKWAEKWKAVETKRKIEKAKTADLKEANRRTEEAVEALRQIDHLLIHTLSVDDKVDWDTLKKNEEFPEKAPPKPVKKTKKKYPPKPDLQSPEFTPVFTILDKLMRSRRERKLQVLEEKYLAALADWERQKPIVDGHNNQLVKEFEAELKQRENDMVKWKERGDVFLREQAEFNAKVDQMKDSYLNQDNASIVEYCDMVLNNSQYPDSFPKNFELEYNPENKILIVEYQLPSSDCFPKVKEVKYITSKNELKESYISDAQANKMFDEAIYRITLRTLHELFEADIANALEAVSFNGWVKAINKATGQEENNCILTIQVKKTELIGVDLANVDPKACFKGLKGVASSKLSGLTPVQPILQITKTDKRFVESYAVADQMDTASNLAAMDWEDFEHLIRELFEKEFQANGGEVKVTQASRDGGVDAIAFDPDPIRGGKIVIQAKRYTNTVGVSAVRDLYGTVVNEGATKGILVSTADYGADAYGFAKDKPLTLLNGANLLYMLEKHGYHVRIDLKEAKKLLAEQA